jgi:hypothetical protein
VSDRYPPPPWSGQPGWSDPHEETGRVPYQTQPGIWSFGPPGGLGYQSVARPRAAAEGIDIAAFILVWIFAPAAVILGYISRGWAKSAGLRPCALSTAAIVLGWIITAVGIIIPAALYIIGSGTR